MDDSSGNSGSNICNQYLQMFLVMCISRLFEGCIFLQRCFSTHELYGKGVTALFTAFSAVGLWQILVDLHGFDSDLFSGCRSNTFCNSLIDDTNEVSKCFSGLTLVFDHCHGDFSSAVNCCDNFSFPIFSNTKGIIKITLWMGTIQRSLIHSENTEK